MTHFHGRCIILIEGLDKCGKTTTAGEIASKLLEFGPVKLIHHGKPTGIDQFREYLEAIYEADRFEGSTIIDRMHWSEEAYGLVYRGGKCLEAQAIDALDEVFAQVGGAVVLKHRPATEVYTEADAHDHSTKGSKVTVQDLDRLDHAFNVRFTTAQTFAIRVRFKQAIDPSFLEEAAIVRTRSIKRKELR